MNHVCTKRSVFEDEIDKHKFGRDGLLEEIRNFRPSNEHLSNKSENTQTELNRSEDKIKRPGI